MSSETASFADAVDTQPFMKDSVNAGGKLLPEPLDEEVGSLPELLDEVGSLFFPQPTANSKEKVMRVNLESMKPPYG